MYTHVITNMHTKMNVILVATLYVCTLIQKLPLAPHIRIMRSVTQQQPAPLAIIHHPRTCAINAMSECSMIRHTACISVDRVYVRPTAARAV